MCVFCFFENTRSLLGCTNQKKSICWLKNWSRYFSKTSSWYFWSFLIAHTITKVTHHFCFLLNTKNTKNWVKSLKSWTYCLYYGGMVTNDKKNHASNGFGPIEKVDVFGSLLLRRKHLAVIKLKVSRGFFFAHFIDFFYGSNIVDFSV